MRRAKVSPLYKGKRKKMKREDAIADAKMARMRARTRSATRNLSPQYSSSPSTAAPPPPPPPAEEPAVNSNKEIIVIDTAGSDEVEEEAWRAMDIGGGEPWDLKTATSFNNWEWEDSLLQLTYEEEWSLFGGIGGGGGYFSNNNNNGGLFEEDWNLWNFNCTTTSTPTHPTAASDRKPSPP